MKIQTGNNWSCLPCSFATVLEIPVEKFIKMIGHDGSYEPYKDLLGQKAGFHEQECIEVAQQLGYACTPIEIVPQIMPVPGGPIRPIWFLPTAVNPEDSNWQRFLYHLKRTRGVITGMKKCLNGEKIGHAVACWNSTVYDSQGGGHIYPIKHFYQHHFMPRVYWKIQEVVNG